MTHNISTASTVSWFSRNWHAQLAFEYGKLDYHKVQKDGTTICDYRAAVVRGLLSTIITTTIGAFLMVSFVLSWLAIWFKVMHNTNPPTEELTLFLITVGCGINAVILTIFVGMGILAVNNKVQHHRLRHGRQSHTAVHVYEPSAFSQMYHSWKQKYCTNVTVDKTDV